MKYFLKNVVNILIKTDFHSLLKLSSRSVIKQSTMICYVTVEIYVSGTTRLFFHWSKCFYWTVAVIFYLLSCCHRCLTCMINDSYCSQNGVKGLRCLRSDSCSGFLYCQHNILVCSLDCITSILPKYLNYRSLHHIFIAIMRWPTYTVTAIMSRQTVAHAHYRLSDLLSLFIEQVSDWR